MTRRLVAATLSLALAGGVSAALVSATSESTSDSAYQFCVGLTKKGGGMDNICVDVGGDEGTIEL